MDTSFKHDQKTAKFNIMLIILLSFDAKKIQLTREMMFLRNITLKKAILLTADVI